MRLTVLSAASGEGKTTFLREQLARLADAGRSVGGILSPAVFEDGRRVGYDVVDLQEQSRLTLARQTGLPPTAPAIGRYRFDTEAIKAGNATIIAAVRQRCDLVAIDEIGPLEFGGGGWAPGLDFALRECGADQELIICVRPGLVAELPSRFVTSTWETARHLTQPWPALIETDNPPV